MMAKMNPITKIISDKWLTSFITLGFILFFSLITPNISSATAVVGFDASHIIDDSVFTNSNSMDVNQIQAFLNSKVPTCDTWHTGFTGTSGTVYNPPFTCLKDYTENGLSAAQIIYNVSQQYQINPQVFIVLLQKEQALITDTWPASYQYRSATGYACGDTSACETAYYGLTRQLYWAATLFHTVITNSQSWSNPYRSGTSWYSPYILGNNKIYYNEGPCIATDSNGVCVARNPEVCGSSTVNIQNRATQALYDYTPYQPNQASLDAGYGTARLCGSYGNRNFYLYFTEWFGSTYAYIHNGVNYSAVFDADYYMSKYDDIKSDSGGNANAAFAHFINFGMREGRQGKSSFNVNAYKNTYPDLRMAYRNNLTQYYIHYIFCGSKEGRVASNDPGITYITSYNGVDYSAVYDYSFYIANHTDIKAFFGNDDASAIEHFALFGIKEGRQAKSDFSLSSYVNRYYDLRRAFGSNRSAYYLHYIYSGIKEGRVATGDEYGGTTIYNGVDYRDIYNFNTYISTYPDLKAAFGNDDIAALSHFVNIGMHEGRQAINNFNVITYKNNYYDLSLAFGNNLKSYYLHYIYSGIKEGRVAI